MVVLLTFQSTYILNHWTTAVWNDNLTYLLNSSLNLPIKKCLFQVLASYGTFYACLYVLEAGFCDFQSHIPTLPQ